MLKKSFADQQKEKYLKKFKKVHGNKYIYSKFIYKKFNAKIEIICKKHGSFWMLIANHLKNGCAVCAGNKKFTIDDFINISNKIHNNKFDYHKSVYKNTNSKLIIICPIHGEYKQFAGNHMRGSGCERCENDRRLMDTQEFIKKCIKVHNGFYIYDKLSYKGNKSKIKIGCPKHGYFFQRADQHCAGRGCQKCVKMVSDAEEKWLNDLGIPNDKNHRQVKLPKLRYRVDGYIPETNTVYEFHGTFWHGHPDFFDSNKKHPVKNKKFGELYNNTIKKENDIIKAGYTLVVMWEHELN